MSGKSMSKRNRLKTIPWAMSFLILSEVVTAAGVDSSANSLRQSAESVERVAVSELGIGLRAIAVLVYADSNVFSLETYLREHGTLQYIQQLESLGFVSVEKRKTDEGTFIRVSRTAKGQLVFDAFR
jgi:hypothetical protein